MKIGWRLASACALWMIVASGSALAGHGERQVWQSRAAAASQPWHGGFYHIGWGASVALVVPPTAEFQSNYGWGVCGTQRSRIDHQFQRPFPGYSEDGYGGFLPTPQWPSNTNQFGVYYVRGPW